MPTLGRWSSVRNSGDNVCTRKKVSPQTAAINSLWNCPSGATALRTCCASAWKTANTRASPCTAPSWNATPTATPRSWPAACNASTPPAPRRVTAPRTRAACCWPSTPQATASGIGTPPLTKSITARAISPCWDIRRNSLPVILKPGKRRSIRTTSTKSCRRRRLWWSRRATAIPLNAPTG